MMLQTYTPTPPNQCPYHESIVYTPPARPAKQHGENNTHTAFKGSGAKDHKTVL